MKEFWKNNIVYLFIAILFVIIFTAAFGWIYRCLGPQPDSRFKNCNTEVYICSNDGKKIRLKESMYEIKVEPQIERVESTMPADPIDYSSYLISFVSVLATFVVIANFANASDLVKAKDQVESARDEVKDAIGQIGEKIGDIDQKETERKQKFDDLSTEFERKYGTFYEEVDQKYADIKTKNEELGKELEGRINGHISSTQVSIEQYTKYLQDTKKYASSIKDELRTFHDSLMAKLEEQQKKIEEYGNIINNFMPLIDRIKNQEESIKHFLDDKANASANVVKNIQNERASIIPEEQLPRDDSQNKNENLPEGSDIKSNKKQ